MVSEYILGRGLQPSLPPSLPPSLLPSLPPSLPLFFPSSYPQLWEVDPSKHRPGQVEHTVGWPLVSGTLYIAQLCLLVTTNPSSLSVPLFLFPSLLSPSLYFSFPLSSLHPSSLHPSSSLSLPARIVGHMVDLFSTILMSRHLSPVDLW